MLTIHEEESKADEIRLNTVVTCIVSMLSDTFTMAEAEAILREVDWEIHHADCSREDE